MSDDLRPLEEDIRRIMREHGVDRETAERTANAIRVLRQARINRQRDRVSFTERGKEREKARLQELLDAEK